MTSRLSLGRMGLRWGLPLGVAAAVIALGLGASTLRATADPRLPTRSAAQLLVDLQNARLDGLSGTVILSTDLGLPAVAGLASGSGGIASLLGGTHTVRVWTAGPDKVRVALLSRLGETDLIRNGRDVWIWSSQERSAEHRRLPEGFATDLPGSLAEVMPITPQEAANRVLAALDPSTVVTTAGTARVAGRAAYELVLAPRDNGSLVSQVRLAVDAEKKLPLRVRVFPRGGTSPAIEIGFQQVSFAVPGDEHFAFTPPPGTNINEDPDGISGERDTSGRRDKPGAGKPSTPGDQLDKPDDKADGPPVRTLGSGWTTIVTGRIPDGQGPLGAILTTLPRVSGDWGAGHLFSSRLLTVLVTDDGRMFAGAVIPDRLYAAAGTK